MKALLVNPPKDAFGFKPIGISLLSAIAKDVDWDTALYDTTEIKMSYDNAFKKHQEARHHKPVDYKKYNLIKKDIDLAERTKEGIKKTCRICGKKYDTKYYFYCLHCGGLK